MNTMLRRFVFILAAAPLLATASPAMAAGCCDKHDGHETNESTAEAETYPLTTCVVSGRSLDDGDMGPPVDYLYKEEGRPDRLVRFCCRSCIKNFHKDPAKYLQMIDDAVSANGQAAPAGVGAPSGHQH